MNEVTRILSAIERGDPQTAAQLLPLVYDELRHLAAQKLAREKPGQTLQATALVHEANTAYKGGGIFSDLGPLTVSGCTLSSNSATMAGGGIYCIGTATVKNSSSITGNSAPSGDGADVYNQGTLYLDSTSKIGVLDGNPSVPI